MQRAALRFVLLFAGSTLALAGCDVIGDLVSGPRVPHIAPLEVWNRTTEDVFLIDSEGRRIDVPACGHLDQPAFAIDAVTLRTDEGYWFGFGDGGYGGDAGRPRYLVLVAADGASMTETVPPAVVPPCQGRPNVQPGV